MLNFIARCLEPVLRFLLPPTGRHRSRCAGRVVQGPLPCTPCSTPTAGVFGRVRSYAVVPVVREREEVRLQRARRRALLLSSYGIDVGPSRIHGVEVTP
ncbi:hypothetical protein GUY60_09725 [Streptomyces sp. YC537]|uniref:Uncharacterized protein n=1 Tax=Streptomyces boluensis TaxID=1775135 RepID=A0A964UPQ0_9ACTN|nr:hypothetical protein [Streptomyces boluensis]